MTRAGTAGGTWRSVVRTGALWGAGAVFLALVGLVEAVSRRQIVAGVLSVSYTFIRLAGFGSGVQGSRRCAGLAAWQRLAGGAAGGAVVGGVVGLPRAVGGGEHRLDWLPLAGETVGRQAGAPAPPGPARDPPGRAGGRHPHVALGDWSSSHRCWSWSVCTR